MNITNHQNLSECWVNAIKKLYDKEERKGFWQSPTSLLQPPRKIFLESRHWNELSVDAADCVWLLLGQAVHSVLESTASNNVIAEQRFILPFMKREIGFKPDRVEMVKGAIVDIRDFKITQIYAWKNFESKHEWIRQLNWYAWGLFRLGFKPRKLSVEMLLKDWDLSDMIRSEPNDYPRTPIVSKDVPLLPYDIIEKDVRERVDLFIQCENLPDDQLPDCTEEERWADKNVWCVKKVETGRTVPKGLKETKEEAEAFIADKKNKEDYRIEFRQGQNRRCMKYCAACSVCGQYMKILRKQLENS